MLIDLHTHRMQHLPGEAVVNCFPETFRPEKGEYYSVGWHPWHVSTPIRDIRTLLLQLRHPQVAAVGEAGLDKLAAAPLALQQEVFAAQARLAEEVRKPLIIHLVRAVPEILKLKHDLHPDMPWIIHGFRGKPSVADELLRHGLYLSFGEKYCPETLRTLPARRLFIETDESDVPVRELYARAAHLRGTSAEELMESVSRNFSDCLKETCEMAACKSP